MAKKPKWLSLPMDTFFAFIEDRCPRMAGALAFFAIYSLPALVVFSVLVVGVLFGEEAVRAEIQRQMQLLLGDQASEQIAVVIENAQDPTQRGSPAAAALGIVLIIYGASRSFVELQDGMNKVWKVTPDPDLSTIKNFILKRLLSFGMMLTIAFLLLVSLVLSTILTAFGDALARAFPGDFSGVVLQAANQGISFVIILLLFAAIYKVLPDAEIWWRDVWLGAFVGTALFSIGKTLIGLYLGNTNIGSAYGAAGSLAIVLIWVHFSAAILYLGAEFTQAWVRYRGRVILPAKGSVAIRQEVYKKKPGEPVEKDDPGDHDRTERKLKEQA